MNRNLDIDYNPEIRRYSISTNGVYLSALTYKRLLADLVFLFMRESQTPIYRLNFTKTARENTKEARIDLLEIW